MTDAYLNIAAQYNRESRVQVLVRPYEVAGPLSTELSLYLDAQALPEPGHGRTVLRAEARMRDAHGAPCLEVACEIEGIAISQGLTEQELNHALRTRVGAALLGGVRAQIQLLSSGTGYPLVVLPPLDAGKLLELSAKPGGEAPSLTSE